MLHLGLIFSLPVNGKKFQNILNQLSFYIKGNNYRAGQGNPPVQKFMHQASSTIKMP